MSTNLPQDLLSAESDLQEALIEYIATRNISRVSINLKFEGLRIMPLAIRLLNYLESVDIDSILVWPDAGATALAKRESIQNKDRIYSIKDMSNIDSSLISQKIIIVVSPQPYDYDEFFDLCENINETVIMLNGRLEDGAVGIGSVGRERRRTFIKSWLPLYWLEPLANGALMRVYPNEWNLYKLYDEGYAYISSFKDKPDQEAIFESLL